MSRRRAAATLIVGLLLGFFAGVAALSLGRDTARRAAPSSAGAAGISAATAMSAQYGAKQAAVHLSLIKTAPIVPFIQTLKLGSKDNVKPGAVLELQRTLVRAGFRPARDKPTGSFGVITQRQLSAFQKAKKIKPVTGIYGPKTHHKLQPYYDLSARRALQAVAHTRAQLQKYAKITHGEAYAWLHRTSMAYSQSASRAFLPLLPGFPHATDCSGYVTWVFKVAGLPDPSGFDYRIVGFTGTLAQHGTRISANAAFHTGDLVFYGGGYPYGHVAIVQNAFLRTVSSHGSPGIKVLPFNYRPVSAVRRYI